MPQKFLEYLGTTTATPEADHLFTVHNEGKTQDLPEEQAQTLHHTVAQLMFMSARIHQYMQTALALLTTGINKPDNNNWEN